MIKITFKELLDSIGFSGARECFDRETMGGDPDYPKAKALLSNKVINAAVTRKIQADWAKDQLATSLLVNINDSFLLDRLRDTFQTFVEDAVAKKPIGHPLYQGRLDMQSDPFLKLLENINKIEKLYGDKTKKMNPRSPAAASFSFNAGKYIIDLTPEEISLLDEVDMAALSAVGANLKGNLHVPKSAVFMTDKKYGPLYKNCPFPVFTGIDMRIITMTPHVITQNITLKTLTYSMHAGLIPVSALGRDRPKGWAKCFRIGTPKLTNRGIISVEQIKTGDLIMSYDESSNISYEQCDGVYDNGIQPLYRVMLKDGSYEDLSKHHRVFTETGYKRVHELTKQDQCTVPITYSFGNRRLDVPDYYIKLLSYGIGDGVQGSYKNGKETRFVLTPGIDDVKIIADIKNICHQNGISYHIDINDEESCLSIRLHNTKNSNCGDRKLLEYHPYIEWTRSLKIYGFHAPDKYIPEEVMNNMSAQQTTLFISRLWGTDGSISVRTDKNVRMEYTTTSRKLAYQLKLMLGTLGIHSRVWHSKTKGKKHPTGFKHNYDIYKVTITKSFFVYKALYNIGIYGKEHWYNKTLPYLQSSIRYDKREYMKICKDNAIKRTKKYSSSEMTIRRSTIFKHHTLEYANYIISSMKPYWDKPVVREYVKSIIKIGSDRTFNISVKENHNVFGMFLSHNSDRTIAGTMIATITVNDPLMDLQPILYGSDNQYANATSDIWRTYLLPDQFPEFDILIMFSSEYGFNAALPIYGVKFSDQGVVMSMSDSEIEVTYTYTALDIDVIRSITGQTNPDGTITSFDPLANNEYLVKRERAYKGISEHKSQFEVPSLYARLDTRAREIEYNKLRNKGIDISEIIQIRGILAKEE